MSLEQEAKAAAEAEYPPRMHLEAALNNPRPPFAHGYQRGYEAGHMAVVESLERFVDGHWEKWDGTVEPGVRYQFRKRVARP